jgi:hypothetical protein
MNEDTAYQMLFPETGKRPEGAADYPPRTNELVTLRQENLLLRESLARAENTLGLAHEGLKGAIAEEKRLRADLDWFIRKAESQWERIKELETEVIRLKRGDFTPEEFQDLCHHRDEKEGCTLEDFSQGCLDYQRKLFGRTIQDSDKG